MEQLRSYRIYGYAIFDFAATYAGAYLIAKYKKWNVVVTFLYLILLSIIVHKLINKKTKLTDDLFEKHDSIAIIGVLLIIYYLSQHKINI